MITMKVGVMRRGVTPYPEQSNNSTPDMEYLNREVLGLGRTGDFMTAVVCDRPENLPTRNSRKLVYFPLTIVELQKIDAGELKSKLPTGEEITYVWDNRYEASNKQALNEVPD